MDINDKAYTLYIEPEIQVKKKKAHRTAWNKGLTWNDMFDENTRKAMKERMSNLSGSKAGNRGKGFNVSRPVIQMDEFGNRLHWYESSNHAARKLGISGRNIRSVCYGEREHCGGFRWKFDEIFC